MTNEECLEKALEYTGITNNCCNKVDRCIFTNHCYCFGEISECEEYTVFKRIKSALERELVRHGTWKESKMKTGGQLSLSIPYYLCSECGGYMDADTTIFKYCPYCGAKMNAERKEE